MTNLRGWIISNHWHWTWLPSNTIGTLSTHLSKKSGVSPFLKWLVSVCCVLITELHEWFSFHFTSILSHVSIFPSCLHVRLTCAHEISRILSIFDYQFSHQTKTVISRRLVTRINLHSTNVFSKPISAKCIRLYKVIRLASRR